MLSRNSLSVGQEVITRQSAYFLPWLWNKRGTIVQVAPEGCVVQIAGYNVSVAFGEMEITNKVA